MIIKDGSIKLTNKMANRLIYKNLKSKISKHDINYILKLKALYVFRQFDINKDDDKRASINNQQPGSPAIIKTSSSEPLGSGKKRKRARRPLRSMEVMSFNDLLRQDPEML